jgi:hypothetical protein
MSDTSQAAIRQRYGFEFPELYQKLLTLGCFSTTPWDNYLDLPECEWLSLDKIATYKFLDFQITSDGGFVPLAITSRRDEYCWRLDWLAESEPPIVFCERGFGYAPHFQGFLYRQTLETFAGFGSPENPRGLAKLQRTVSILAPHLSARWSSHLNELAKYHFADWKKGKQGEMYLVEKNELSAAIIENLSFPHLNESFVLDKERAQRSKS